MDESGAKRRKLEEASAAASTPPHSRGAGGGCDVDAAPGIDPNTAADELYGNASLVVYEHYDEDETYADNFDVILAQMIGTQTEDVPFDDAAGAGEGAPPPASAAGSYAAVPASAAGSYAAAPASAAGSYVHALGDEGEFTSASQSRGPVAAEAPAGAAGRLRAEEVVRLSHEKKRDVDLAELAQRGAEEELDGEWWLDPDEQLIELIKDDDNEDGEVGDYYDAGEDDAAAGAAAADAGDDDDDGDGEGDDTFDDGGDVFDPGRINSLIKVLSEYEDGNVLDDIDFTLDATIAELDTGHLPAAQAYYSVLAQNLTTKTQEASTIEEAAASASAEGEEAQVRRSTRNRAVKVATLMLPPAAKRILNLKKQRKDAEKRKKAIEDIKNASAQVHASASAAFGAAAVSRSAASPGLGAAAAAKPPKLPVLTVAAAKEQLNQLLTRAGGPRKVGRAGSAAPYRVASAIHSVVGSYATQCPGVRGDIDFQKSSNTLKWIYGNPSKVNLYCYLCSLRIPEGENAHFEHVLAFLSALAKGLIPVRKYVGGDFDRCLLFVQGCLGEWAHQHCNSTCKGELDFTNNRKRPARNVSWAGLAPDIETIKKVLRCIWNQTTAGTTDLRPQLRKIYGSEANFINVQLSKIYYRVQMCITMIKCFVDFGRYRKTKVFLKNAGLAYANAKLAGNFRYPIGPIIQSHFDRPDRHPIDYMKVRSYLGTGAGQVHRDIASSQKMYLERPIPPANRNQTLVPYPNATQPSVTTDVHPTDRFDYTFGWQAVHQLQDCGVSVGDYSLGGAGGSGAGAGAASASGTFKAPPKKGTAEDDYEDLGGSRRNKVRGDASASTRRQRQRQQKKLLTQKRQKPQVTVQIVPYQP